jgi:hypothetical protein
MFKSKGLKIAAVAGALGAGAVITTLATMSSGISQSVESGGSNYFPRIRVTGGTIDFGTGIGSVTGNASTLSTAQAWSSARYTATAAATSCGVTLGAGAYYCTTDDTHYLSFDGADWTFTDSLGLLSTSGEFCFGSTSAQCLTYGGAGIIQTKAGTAFTVTDSTFIAGALTDLRSSIRNTGSAAPCVGNTTAICLNETSGVAVADGSDNSMLRLDSRGVTYLGTIPRKRLGWQASTNADTDFDTPGVNTIGVAASTEVNGGAACATLADTADNAYAMIQFKTDTSGAGSACGRVSTFDIIRATFLPSFSAVVRSDPSLTTSQTVFVGMAASSLAAVTTLAGANGIRGCWFRYDTGLSDTVWQGCSSDGTTASCGSTGVTFAAATTYTLGIDNTVSGTCDYYVNGVRRLNKSNNINVGNTALGIEATITARAGAARNLSVSKVIVEEN